MKDFQGRGMAKLHAEGRAHVRALNERNAIIAAIGEAQDAHQLHYFSKVRIPRLPLADEMKADLQLRVALRFSALNEVAVGKQNPRFGGVGSGVSPDGSSRRLDATKLQEAA